MNLESPSGNIKAKIIQNGHYYKWEDCLESQVLEASAEKAHKDITWRAEWLEGEC
jgi:hypothetical protein